MFIDCYCLKHINPSIFSHTENRCTVYMLLIAAGFLSIEKLLATKVCCVPLSGMAWCVGNFVELVYVSHCVKSKLFVVSFRLSQNAAVYLYTNCLRRQSVRHFICLYLVIVGFFRQSMLLNSAFNSSCFSSYAYRY